MGKLPMLNFSIESIDVPSLIHTITIVLCIILAYEVGKVALRVFWMYNPLVCSSNLIKRYGKCWAVVTGASSGIGYQYAISLAKRGFDVIIIARRKDKLEALREELQGLGADVLVLPYDLSEATPTNIKRLVSDMGSREIGVFVANAGISEIAYHFTDLTTERSAEMINLNCMSLALMFQELLPKLVNRPAGLRSGVVTLGALNAQIPMPQFALSAGTKAFIRQFSRVVGKTLDSYVDVLCAHPFAVESEIVKTSTTSFLGRLFLMSTPAQFAEGTLRQLGWSRETFGSPIHEWVHGLWLALTPDEANMSMNYGLTNLFNALLKRDLRDPDIKKKLVPGDECKQLLIPA